MKLTASLRTLMALALAALLLLAAPAALAEETNATPPAGASWDMTVDDTLALEGATKADGEYELGGGYIQYAFQHEKNGYTYATVYIFYGEQLVMYGDYTDARIQTGEVPFGEICVEWIATLTETLGEPTVDDKQSAVMIANAAVRDGWMTEENIAEFAGWTPEEGVILYCMHFTSKGEDIVFAIYIKAALLFEV